MYSALLENMNLTLFLIALRQCFRLGGPQNAFNKHKIYKYIIFKYPTACLFFDSTPYYSVAPRYFPTIRQTYQDRINKQLSKTTF